MSKEISDYNPLGLYAKLEETVYLNTLFEEHGEELIKDDKINFRYSFSLKHKAKSISLNAIDFELICDIAKTCDTGLDISPLRDKNNYVEGTFDDSSGKSRIDSIDEQLVPEDLVEEISEDIFVLSGLAKKGKYSASLYEKL